MKRTAQVVEALSKPEHTYVASWAHGNEGRKHLHLLVQPVTTETVRQYGGALSEQLQARMLLSAEEPAREDVERFCDRARELFQDGYAPILDQRHERKRDDSGADVDPQART